ncbi:MAG: type II secretion system minor pseudopilin GspJ [Gammaproteobacteria bacterium]|nr:type II secretion system minor pseudopilin GspJ [Gammaproteobacteria bacterium]
MKRSGFTLMEMLVALALFAMIGLISSQMLYQTADLSLTMVGRSEYITDVHRAMSVLDRDIRQIVNRGIRDELGEFYDALTIDDARLLQFSRMGWLNPLDEERGTVQRVEYSIEDNTLTRRYWHVMDRNQESVAVKQIIMRGQELSFELLDSQGEVLSTYPEPLDVEELIPEIGDPLAGEDEEEPRPIAIRLNFVLPNVGEFNRMWMIPNMPTIPEVEVDQPEVPGTTSAVGH